MQMGVAPQKLLFLGKGNAADGDTGCNSNSEHARTAQQ